MRSRDSRGDGSRDPRVGLRVWQRTTPRAGAAEGHAVNSPRLAVSVRPHARVLVVDDEPTNLRVLEKIMARAGYLHVVSTTEGSAALELVSSVQPDIILLDLRMPGTDGMSVLRALPSVVSGDSFLPVLVLSGDDSPGARQDALEAGAHDFVLKPFDAAEVLLRIRNLLDVRFLREELQAQNRRLEDQLRHSQRLEVLGRLVGGIAHDFNNLLMIVRGNTELILEQTPADSQLRDDVHETLRALDSVSALTRRLLGFSRPESLQPRTLELTSLLTDVSRTLLPLLGARVRVEMRLLPETLAVLGDPGQFEQMIMNLAVNARDAMPAGGRLEIATARERVTEPLPRNGYFIQPAIYAHLSVSDTGHGMNEKTRERAFDPYFTTREGEGGTGLGLSIVYGIVKQFGGYVWVESEPGRGTAFHVYLPLLDDVAHPAKPVSSADEA